MSFIPYRSNPPGAEWRARVKEYEAEDLARWV